MNNTVYSKPGSRHSEAIRGLEYFTEDLKILDSRLTEVSSRSNRFEARQGIEHFQNQFYIQQKNIHDLMHKFREHEPVLEQQAQKHASEVSMAQIEKEKKLLDDYDQLEKVISELKHEFDVFLGQWM
jgi:hypothetical protein